MIYRFLALFFLFPPLVWASASDNLFAHLPSEIVFDILEKSKMGKTSRLINQDCNTAYCIYSPSLTLTLPSSQFTLIDTSPLFPRLKQLNIQARPPSISIVDMMKELANNVFARLFSQPPCGLPLEEIIHYFANPAHLMQLDVRVHTLPLPFLISLSDFIHLTHLHISALYNRAVIEDLSPLTLLPLKELHLACPGLTDTALSLLSCFSQLHDLRIQSDDIKGDCLNHLTALLGLRYLDISHNKKVQMGALKKLTQLDYLNLSHCPVDYIDSPFSALTQLKAIELRNTQFNHFSSLSFLSQFTYLTLLDVRHNPLLTAPDRINLLKTFPFLNIRLDFFPPHGPEYENNFSFSSRNQLLI